MHVVHPGGEADYHMIIERHHEVMARIIEELGTPLRRNRVVEDARRNVVKNGPVVAAE